MAIDLKPINEYVKAIEKELVAGNATEHTHRPALKALIEGLAEKVTATNEPTHIECGAPDFVVTKGVITIGYQAKELARETGFLKTRLGSDVRYDLEKAPDYLDRLSHLSG